MRLATYIIGITLTFFVYTQAFAKPLPPECRELMWSVDYGIHTLAVQGLLRRRTFLLAIRTSPKDANLLAAEIVSGLGYEFSYTEHRFLQPDLTIRVAPNQLTLSALSVSRVSTRLLEGIYRLHKKGQVVARIDGHIQVISAEKYLSIHLAQDSTEEKNDNPQHTVNYDGVEISLTALAILRWMDEDDSNLQRRAASIK